MWPLFLFFTYMNINTLSASLDRWIKSGRECLSAWQISPYGAVLYTKHGVHCGVAFKESRQPVSAHHTREPLWVGTHVSVFVCVILCAFTESLCVCLTDCTCPSELVWEWFSTCILAYLNIFVLTSQFLLLGREKAFQSKFNSYQPLISVDVWELQPIDWESMTQQCVVKWSA